MRYLFLLLILAGCGHNQPLDITDDENRVIVEILKGKDL